MGGTWRAWWRRAGRVRRAGWALALALAGALCVPLRVSVRSAGLLAAPPARLAHLLADFNTHRRLYPHLGSWTVEEDGGNYTTWRYTVSYECGARCSGRATVHAHALHASGGTGTGTGAAPAHGQPHAHRVLVTHRACTHAPLLPWPRLCDEWETDTEVTGAAGGARLSELATCTCGALRVLSGRCAAELRAHRDMHLRRLRDILAHPET